MAERQRRVGREEWGEGRMIVHQTEKIPGSKRGHLWDGWNGRPKVQERKSLKAKKKELKYCAKCLLFLRPAHTPTLRQVYVPDSHLSL